MPDQFTVLVHLSDQTHGQAVQYPIGINEIEREVIIGFEQNLAQRDTNNRVLMKVKIANEEFAPGELPVMADTTE